MCRLYFWDNISWLNRYLIKSKQITLADCLNWPVDVITGFELGETPTLDELSKLHRYFGLSFQQLLESDISEIEPEIWWNHYLRQRDKKDSTGQQVLFEIPLNFQKAGAGGYSTVKPIEATKRHLAKICVPADLFPNKNPENLRAFEIEGFSMHPTVHSGHVIIAQKLSPQQELQEGATYILKLKDGSLYYKRIFKMRNDKSKIQLSSDNPDYAQIIISIDEIEEYWLGCQSFGGMESDE